MHKLRHYDLFGNLPGGLEFGLPVCYSIKKFKFITITLDPKKSCFNRIRCSWLRLLQLQTIPRILHARLTLLVNLCNPCKEIELVSL